ncbi:MAG: peptidoglycan bridge formation glycyltransferase FemA/FemB family protein, partial [bacterium]|nr:peptidoglycan bridge formation glycyltransferase FemA/FemB family protein [bacterium]
MEVKSVVTGKRGVSLPFTDYCPPVVRDRAEIGGVIKEITKVGLARGWKYVEIRDPFMSSNGRKPCSNYVLHSLELGTNEKEVFSRFRASTRRNIRKAVKEGMEVRIGKSLDDLNEFCNLNCLTRKRHGLPPQPKKFFKTLFTEIILAGHGMLYLGLHGGKSIAGAIFVNSGKTAIFK